jgi:hypothetical protein
MYLEMELWLDIGVVSQQVEVRLEEESKVNQLTLAAWAS